MSDNSSIATYSRVIGGLILALAVLSVLPISIPPPDAWLIQWTEWLAVAIGIAVSAKSIWVVAEAAAFRLKHGPGKPVDQV